uniref:Uncharacterized protein n=1 Tax=Arundo donax TaxID=35708 RepID=A0A0A9B477_ARUDO
MVGGCFWTTPEELIFGCRLGKYSCWFPG